jgi:hypothetical protein
MKIKLLLSVISVSVLIISCTPSKFYIDDDFKNAAPESRLIVTKVNEIDISQALELFTLDNLRKVRNTFFEYQRDYLPIELRNISKFKSVSTSSYSIPPQFEKKEYVVNEKENVEIMIPKTPLKFEQQGVDYVLFFEDYKIGFELEEMDSSDPAKVVSTEKLPGLEPLLKPNKLYKLEFVIRNKYFIYDNNNAKVVIAGNAIVKERYSPEMNLEKILFESLNGLAKRVINKTPFSK